MTIYAPDSMMTVRDVISFNVCVCERSVHVHSNNAFHITDSTSAVWMCFCVLPKTLE